MNILPKKRWHVRTKENITRVRRDEAKAAEEERQRKERIQLAERETRTKLLRTRARLANAVSDEFISLSANEPHEHVNLFKEVEDGTAEYKKPNAEYEKEKKDEREKYEKQVGYLTYLGQDTNEMLKKQNWYEMMPDRSSIIGEVNVKSKSREDPLNIMKKYTEKLIGENEKVTNITYPSVSAITSSHKTLEKKVKKKRKKEKKQKSEKKKLKHEKKKHKHRHSDDDISGDVDDEEQQLKRQKLEVLRMERLNREAKERSRAEDLLSGKDKQQKPTETIAVTRKYNSQFNPELAKQNYKSHGV